MADSETEFDGDYEWQPPSEGQMKVLEARRERSDRISKLIGPYLLKGYKMLNDLCPECSTILLEDKHSAKYCVACSELDSDVGKDDPALNSEAARRRVLENQSMSSHSTSSIPQSVAASTLSYHTTINGLPPPPTHTAPRVFGGSRPPTSVSVTPVAPCNVDISTPQSAVQQKMEWAAAQLVNDNSIENSIQLCQLIKKCGETLLTLQQVKSPTNETTG